MVKDVSSVDSIATPLRLTLTKLEFIHETEINCLKVNVFILKNDVTRIIKARAAQVKIMKSKRKKPDDEKTKEKICN